MTTRLTSFFRIDDRVFFAMGGLCLFSMIVFAFRYAAHHECLPIKIQVLADSLTANHNIDFKADAAPSKSYSWDFGDSSKQQEDNASTHHTYKKAGHYLVSLTIDGECSEFTDVAIGEEIMVASVQLPIISGHDTAYINEAVSYRDLSSNSKNWNWNFGESSGTDASGNPAVYTYLTTGPKTIKLEVNNRSDLVTQKQIIVVDRKALTAKPTTKPKDLGTGSPKVVIVHTGPSEPQLTTTPSEQPIQKREEEAPKPKAKVPDISKELFESMLWEVAAGTKRADDFSKYLCSNSMEVSYNDKITTFSNMCDDLKSVGKKKIKSFSSLIIQKDPETNCIRTITVAIKKKSFLGL